MHLLGLARGAAEAYLPASSGVGSDLERRNFELSFPNPALLNLTSP